MALQANPYPLRIDPELMAKLKVVAKREGRSVNKAIEQLVEQAVSAHESKFGKIILPSE